METVVGLNRQIATRHFAVPNGLTVEFKVGTALAAARQMAESLKAQGFTTSQTVPLAKEAGMLDLRRGDLQLTIPCMDPGPLPAEMSIAAPKLRLNVQP
jgi:hypothetical protein